MKELLCLKSEETLGADPPLEPSPALFTQGGAGREDHADIAGGDDPRHEQIVFADIHIEVAEAVGAEIEPLGESVVLAHAPVGSAAYGA